MKLLWLCYRATIIQPTTDKPPGLANQNTETNIIFITQVLVVDECISDNNCSIYLVPHTTS